MATKTVLLPLVGKPEHTDPYRAPVPSYSMALVDYIDRRALTSVQFQTDEDMQALLALAQGIVVVDDVEYPDLTSVNPADIAAVFKTTYAEWYEAHKNG